MDVTITDESDRTVEFELSGASPAFANALRRTMIGRIPTLAIEDVVITKNNTGLFDEIIAHRLGLLPWEFKQEHYEYTEDDNEAEEDDPLNTVTFVLNKEGEGTVTASDLKPTDEDVSPVNPDAKIADMHEDGKIELEATAQLGLGKHHAKWQAANAAYSYEQGDDTFHFTVESVSGLDPRTIVLEAVRQLEDDVEAFESNL